VSALLLLFLLSASPASSERPGDLVLHNATIIEGTGAPPRIGDVLIRSGRIESVGACRHPGHATVIDATGKYVLPGFIDMHVHLLEHGRNEKGDIPPRVDWDVVRTYLRLLLDHGVTTVRDPGSETEAAVTLRNMIGNGAIAGPRLLTAGRIINASPFNPEPFQPVVTADDIRREIRWQHAAGVDFIKLYGSVPPDLAGVAVQEAHALGLPVMGHLFRTTWREAAEMGIDAIAHGAPWTPDLIAAGQRAGYQANMLGRIYWLNHVALDGPEFRATVDALVRKKVSVDPTLIAYHTKFFGNDRRWLENPDNSMVPSSLVAGWRAGSFTREWTAEQYAQAHAAWPRMLELTRTLFERGVWLTVGTDAPTAWIIPGSGFHEELTLLRDAGIPEHAIIRMATFDAARALGRSGEFGSIQNGLRADLVVLRANPLTQIENTRLIDLVIKDGRVVRGPRSR
jgi:imidazolonepropionase-like amidohydrolase